MWAWSNSFAWGGGDGHKWRSLNPRLRTPGQAVRQPLGTAASAVAGVSYQGVGAAPEICHGQLAQGVGLCLGQGVDAIELVDCVKHGGAPWWWVEWLE
jgi:hypothetical protein